jgi:hypothetical protein
VVNVEVPVRVFMEDIFIDDLTIADFEILENSITRPMASSRKSGCG